MNCFHSALLFGRYILINLYIWFSILISQDNILPSLFFVSSFITTPSWLLKWISTPRNALSPLFHKLKLSPKSFQFVPHFLRSLTVPCVSRNEIISNFYFSNQLKNVRRVFSSIKPFILMVTKLKASSQNKWAYIQFIWTFDQYYLHTHEWPLEQTCEYNYIMLSNARCSFQDKQSHDLYLTHE